MGSQHPLAHIKAFPLCLSHGLPEEFGHAHHTGGNHLFFDIPSGKTRIQFLGHILMISSIYLSTYIFILMFKISSLSKTDIFIT